ncbi:MAG: ATP-binding protein [Burkholderiales bacterium]
MNPDFDRLLLDQSGELLLAVDPQTQQIVAANRAAAELLDYPPAMLVGRAITELEGALSDVFFWDEVRQGARGEVSNVESQYLRSDGTMLPVVKTVRRVPFAGRDYLVLRIRDARSLKEAESGLAQLSSQLKGTLEATGDGILVVDTEGHIVNMNRRFSDMWEIPERVLLDGEDAITSWIANRLHDPDAYRRGMNTAVENLETESFDILTLVDGRVYEYRSRPQTIDDQIVGRVFSIHDITDRVSSERELIKARDAANASARAKAEFLANMSHEIRTPMNGVIGMAQMLADTTLTDEQREYTRAILDSAASLLTVINDILDFSKVEAGKLELETVDFNPKTLAKDLLTPFGPTAMKKCLALTLVVADDVPDHVRGDPGRLRQILNNLIGNALKFTERGEVAVNITREAGNPGAARLRFEVRDTGIGMNEETIANLFAPFFQGDASTSRRYGGTGLGLSISQRLARLMGGALAVESRPGAGSTFILTVPFAIGVAPTVKSAAPPLLPQLPPHAHVLVVEDNPVNQKVARAMLSKLGIRASVAGNGEEAIDILKRVPCDLVLMDCQMPVMDGYEATRRIRAGAAGAVNSEIRIVAMTANAMQGDREVCLAAGMNDHLTKPMTGDALAIKLAEWLPRAVEHEKS